jgi:predicted choloylglycine hydrolase
MQIECFSGDFFEIGNQQGKFYRKNGMNLNNIKIDEKLFKKQLKIYEKHYPEFLEELKGIAKGGNFDENKTIYFFTTSEMLSIENLTRELTRGCTIFGVRNKNGIFVGRNYDWFPNTEKVFRIYKVKNPKVNSFLTITDMGIESNNFKPKDLVFFPEDIINDKGLFVGISFAYRKKILAYLVRVL